MKRPIVGACVSVFAAALAVTTALAQSPQRAPTTGAGHPDLSGFWYFGTATPLERPRDLADIDECGELVFAVGVEAALEP